jgi:ProP effector
MHPIQESPAAGTPSDDAAGPDAKPEAATSPVPVPETQEPAPVHDMAAAAPAQAVPASPRIPDLSPAACAARLAELFPAVFTPGQPKPLKLRIQADIQERAPGIFTRKSLSAFLHRHTTSTAYLRTLVDAPARIDLGGQPAGDVATEHREAATAELKRRRDLFEARRAAERQLQREAQRHAQRATQDPAHPVPAGTAPDTVPQTAARAPGEAPPSQREPRRTPPANGERQRVPRPQSDAQQPPGARGEPRRGQVGHGTRPPRPEAGDARHAQATQSKPTLRDAAAPPSAQAPQTPQDPQRRERQALLRAYESSTLTRRNFCALKGMSEAELDAQLALARQDAAIAVPASNPASQPRDARLRPA